MRRGTAACLHVLHVVPGLAPGGMEIAMARVIRGLANRPIRHSIVCLKGEAVIRDLIPSSVEIHCLHASPNELRLPIRLRRLLRLIRPDVIHARNWGAWPDVALARLGMRPAIPLVFSFHGFAHVGRMPYRRRVAFRTLPRITTCLLTVCEATREMLIREFGWPAGRVEMIFNGVDTDRFVPKEPPPHSGRRVVVGTVGSLTPVKNQAVLIRVLADLASAGIECELRIAGNGPEGERLRQLVGSLGLSGRVLLAGHVANVPEFLQGLDIFALPSLSEAHPNALLEAMACGLPCVASGVGGATEVLDAGRFGRLVRPADQRELAGAIAELARDPALRRSLGQAARQRVLDLYDVRFMIDSYAELYFRVARGIRRHADFCPPATPRSLPRVLMLGPTPPLTGGMATVVENLRCSCLGLLCRLEVLNNGKTTPPGRTLYAGIWSQLALLVKVLRQTVRGRAQIVHIHTCALFSFWRDVGHALAVRMLGRKVIWHIHDGTFAAFLGEGPALKRRLIRWALRMGSAVIVLSEISRRSLAPLAAGLRWRVVPNGVAVPEQPARQTDSTVRFLFLGNLTRRKGAFDLVDAAEAAFKQGASAEFHLAGGEVEPGQRDELLRHIKGLSCRECIRLLGVLAGAAKERALAESHCVVLPSYAEGLPMAILEGMAYGRAIIATRVGAIPELITDGREGFLIEPGDVSALAERMTRLSDDAHLARRMGLAARERVERDHSLEVMVQRIAAIYSEVCQTHNATVSVEVK